MECANQFYQDVQQHREYIMGFLKDPESDISKRIAKFNKESGNEEETVDHLNTHKLLSEDHMMILAESYAGMWGISSTIYSFVEVDGGILSVKSMPPGEASLDGFPHVCITVLTKGHYQPVLRHILRAADVGHGYPTNFNDPAFAEDSRKPGFKLPDDSPCKSAHTACKAISDRRMHAAQRYSDTLPKSQVKASKNAEEAGADATWESTNAADQTTPLAVAAPAPTKLQLARLKLMTKKKNSGTAPAATVPAAAHSSDAAASKSPEPSMPEPSATKSELGNEASALPDVSNAIPGREENGAAQPELGNEASTLPDVSIAIPGPQVNGAAQPEQSGDSPPDTHCGDINATTTPSAAPAINSEGDISESEVADDPEYPAPTSAVDTEVAGHTDVSPPPSLLNSAEAKVSSPLLCAQGGTVEDIDRIPTPSVSELNAFYDPAGIESPSVPSDKASVAAHESDTHPPGSPNEANLAISPKLSVGNLDNTHPPGSPDEANIAISPKMSVGNLDNLDTIPDLSSDIVGEDFAKLVREYDRMVKKKARTAADIRDKEEYIRSREADIRALQAEISSEQSKLSLISETNGLFSHAADIAHEKIVNMKADVVAATQKRVDESSHRVGALRSKLSALEKEHEEAVEVEVETREAARQAECAYQAACMLSQQIDWDLTLVKADMFSAERDYKLLNDQLAQLTGPSLDPMSSNISIVDNNGKALLGRDSQLSAGNQTSVSNDGNAASGSAAFHSEIDADRDPKEVGSSSIPFSSELTTGTANTLVGNGSDSEDRSPNGADAASSVGDSTTT